MTPRIGEPFTTDDDDDEGVDAASVDLMIEAALARTPRPIDWSHLSAEDAAEVWLALDEWVRALVTRYALDHRDVPPCWYAHGDLVEELTALWVAHQGAYERTGPATGPADWHHLLAATRSRLQLAAARTGCRNDQHRPPTAPAWANEPAPAGYTSAFIAHVDHDATTRHEPTTAASKPSKPTSAPGSKPGTSTPDPLPGPRPQNRSSNPSDD